MNYHVELIKFYKVQSIVETFSSINKYQFIVRALTKIILFLLLT